MPSENHVCQGCGHQTALEELQSRRVREPGRAGKPKVLRKLLLCAECLEKFAAVDERVEKGSCSQCGTRLQPGEGQMRSVQENQVVGAVAWSRTHHVLICDKCAADKEDSASGMIVPMAIFLILFVVVGLLAILFR